MTGISSSVITKFTIQNE